MKKDSCMKIIFHKWDFKKNFTAIMIWKFFFQDKYFEKKSMQPPNLFSAVVLNINKTKD